MHIMAQEGVTVPGSASQWQCSDGTRPWHNLPSYPSDLCILTIRLLNEQSDDEEYRGHWDTLGVVPRH